jgi:hypothetical protein
VAREHAFEYERVNNSYYGIVRNGEERMMVHDKPDQATMDRSHKEVFDIGKSLGRDVDYHSKPYYLPDGPHEKRFDNSLDFDKSCQISFNQRPTCITDFKKQSNRNEDSVIKGGQVGIDLKPRCSVVYDGATDKDLITPKLTNGILQ